MKVRNDRYPKGLDMGPRRLPLSYPHTSAGVLEEGETWKQLSTRGFGYRALLRSLRAAPERRALASACRQCGQAFAPKSVRGEYCGPTCRQSAWRKRRETRS